MSLHIYDQWPKPSYLAYFFYMSWHRGCPPWQTVNLAPKKWRETDVPDTRPSDWPVSGVPSLAQLLPFTQVTARELIGVTQRQTIAERRRWATALMWQIWERQRVRDRRGARRNSGARRADAQSRTGVKNKKKRKQEKRKTGLSPLTRRPLCSAGLRRRRRRRQLAYFHPPTLPLCLRQNPWVCLFPPAPLPLTSCVWSDRIIRLTLYRKNQNQIKLYL